jgi:hypothetical protein
MNSDFYGLALIMEVKQRSALIPSNTLYSIIRWTIISILIIVSSYLQLEVHLSLYHSPLHSYHLSSITCELLSWVSVRRPSVSFSHLNLLLWNRWTDFNQTCQKCSLDGPLPDCVFGADLKSNMAAKCEKLTDGRTDAYPWQKLTWAMARWAKKELQ